MEFLFPRTHFCHCHAVDRSYHVVSCNCGEVRCHSLPQLSFHVRSADLQFFHRSHESYLRCARVLSLRRGNSAMLDLRFLLLSILEVARTWSIPVGGSSHLSFWPFR